MFERLHNHASLVIGGRGLIGHRRAHKSEDAMRFVIERIRLERSLTLSDGFSSAAFARKESRQFRADIGGRRYEGNGSAVRRNGAVDVAAAFQRAPLQKQKIRLAGGGGGRRCRRLHRRGGHPNHDACASDCFTPIAPLPHWPAAPFKTRAPYFPIPNVVSSTNGD